MKKMNKIQREDKRGLLITCLVIFAILFFTAVVALVESFLQVEIGTGDVLSIVISAVETVGLLASALIAIKQLADSKNVAHASFITELNESFVGNESYFDVYNKLQNCLDDTCLGGHPCGDRQDLDTPCCCEISKGQISNYLTFFETIYILVERGVIYFDVLDDLFAYRFFLAVHSKIVQQQKIKPQPQNFKNIFCLEHQWLEYRKRIGKYTERENTIYGTLLLRDLVTEEQYLELTKQAKPKR